LIESRLDKFANGEKYLADMSTALDEKYNEVNNRILSKKNSHFSVNNLKKTLIKTLEMDKEELEFIGDTLSNQGYTPIF